MATGNLGDLIDRSADPDKIALVDLFDEREARRLSHGDIDREANAVARALLARGYARGERIAILAANRAEFLTAYLGIMRAGLVAVPVNWKFPPPTIRFILEDADCRLVFCDAERRAAVPEALPVVDFDRSGGRGFARFLDPGPFEPVVPAPDEIAMFLYTSGSTGRPKGVPLTHAGHLWVVQRRIAAAKDPAHHRFLVAAPLYHMNALATCKLALGAHATIVLMPQFRAPAYIAAIGEHRVTWMTSVPTMLALIAQEEATLARTDLSSVEIVGMGSAPATLGLIHRMRAIFPQARIAYGYGTTEAGPVAFGPHPAGLPTPDLALGVPVPDIGFRLIGSDGREADEGVMEMKCPAVMPGYHNMPEKTREAITPDGYYRTGDVMRRDADGFIWFVGRADDMFVCGGENIYPGEVEKMLETDPRIAQACIVPVADEVRGQKPVAFVVPANGAMMTEREVKEYALANAPPYQHPRHVAFVPALPLASTSKIDRKALTDRAAALWG